LTELLSCLPLIAPAITGVQHPHKHRPDLVGTEGQPCSRIWKHYSYVGQKMAKHCFPDFSANQARIYFHQVDWVAELSTIDRVSYHWGSASSQTQAWFGWNWRPTMFTNLEALQLHWAKDGERPLPDCSADQAKNIISASWLSCLRHASGFVILAQHAPKLLQPATAFGETCGTTSYWKASSILKQRIWYGHASSCSCSDLRSCGVSAWPVPTLQVAMVALGLGLKVIKQMFLHLPCQPLSFWSSQIDLQDNRNQIQATSQVPLSTGPACESSFGSASLLSSDQDGDRFILSCSTCLPRVKFGTLG